MPERSQNNLSYPRLLPYFKAWLIDCCLLTLSLVETKNSYFIFRQKKFVMKRIWKPFSKNTACILLSFKI